MSAASFEMSHDQWFPVAPSREVDRRAICQAKLLGQELAVWRSDDGAVNAWENRCVHRSVRLTIGLNLGMEVRCPYHGWRYATGTGQCTRIPAHPNLTPAKSICIKKFPVQERYGFVWAAIGNPTGQPELLELGNSPTVTLRSLPFHIAAERLTDILLETGLTLETSGENTGSSPEWKVSKAGSHKLKAAGSNPGETALLFIQPAEPERVVLHGCLPGAARSSANEFDLLRRLSNSMTRLRRRIESARAPVGSTAAPPQQSGTTA